MPRTPNRGWRRPAMSAVLAAARRCARARGPGTGRRAESTMVDFGAKDVPIARKQEMVGEVFKSVAPSYDVMNDLMSIGMHRMWKNHLVGHMLRPFAGQRHLDVAGGTGDVGVRVARAILAAERAEGWRAATAGAAPTSKRAEAGLGGVTVLDINPAMLAEGRRRAADDASLDDVCRSARPVLRADETGFVEGNAETLENLPDAEFDSYTIAFGMRNVPQRERALAAAHRVLKPGGRFLCMEFSPHVWVSLGSKQPPYATPPIAPADVANFASLPLPRTPAAAAEAVATSVAQLGYDA